MMTTVSEKLAFFLVPPPQTLNIQGEDHQTFPIAELDVSEDIALRIFQALPPGEIPKAVRVCKTWCRIVCAEDFWHGYDIKILIPQAKVIDKAVWQRRVPLSILEQLKFGEGVRPCLDRSTFREIRLLQIPGDKITFLEFPEGFSYKLLKEICRDNTLGPLVNLWVGLSPRVRDFEEDARNGFINLRIQNAHTVVITNEILPGSEKFSEEDKIKLVQSRGLGLLDAATLNGFTHREASSVPQGVYASADIFYPIGTMCAEVITKSDGIHAEIRSLKGSLMIHGAAGTYGVGAKWVLKNIKI